MIVETPDASSSPFLPVQASSLNPAITVTVRVCLLRGGTCLPPSGPDTIVGVPLVPSTSKRSGPSPDDEWCRSPGTPWKVGCPGGGDTFGLLGFPFSN